MHLAIRKVQYAPEKQGPQPMVEISRSFLMSDRSLHLEASLDKEVARTHFDMPSIYMMTGIRNAKSLSLFSYTTTVSP